MVLTFKTIYTIPIINLFCEKSALNFKIIISHFLYCSKKMLEPELPDYIETRTAGNRLNLRTTQYTVLHIFFSLFTSQKL